MQLIPLTNTNVKKIVCVYQLQYKNHPSPGIGDFIRGCFYVMQLAKLLNIEFELDISNHPIQKYVENSGKNPNIHYHKLEWIMGLNRPPQLWKTKNNHIDIEFANTIINKLNHYYGASGTYAFFTNAFPIFYNFSADGKETIRNMLRPKPFMQEYVERTLKEMKLEKNTYATIHIRSGDKYLTNNKLTMDLYFLNKVKQKIKRFIVPDKKYLIISDSTVLKASLKSQYNPYFYIINKQIEHLGGENMKSSQTPGIMNTLLDFYLMSYSNAIIALSVYDHISGFSQYCATIHNIPFSFIIL